MPGRRTKNPVPPGVFPDDPLDLYVQKGLSLEEIARILKGRKGCSFGHLRRRCANEFWGKKRDAYEAKVRQEMESRSAVTEAEHRASQLAGFRKVQKGAISALDHLLPSIERGTFLIGEKQGNLNGLKEIAQTLAIVLEGATDLVDDRDDRFSALLEAAAEVAGTEMTDVTDLTTDEELLESMTTRGLEDLALVINPQTPVEHENGKEPPEPAVTPSGRGIE